MARKRHYSTDDQINAAVHRLVHAGWERISKNRHWKLRSPDGKLTVTVPGSPTDHRAGKNWISDLRRQGIEVPA